MNPTAASIAGIICEKYDVLCEADGFSLHSANLYLEGISFISITYAVPVSWTSKIFFFHSLTCFSQYCIIWALRFLWSDARRTRRSPTDGQVHVDQVNSHVYVLSIIYGALIFLSAALLHPSIRPSSWKCWKAGSSMVSHTAYTHLASSFISTFQKPPIGQWQTPPMAWTRWRFASR
jgi:hypothetical protein